MSLSFDAHRRAGDVEMRPRGVADEALDEHRRARRAALPAADILHVGEFRIDHLVVALADRHAPDSLAGGLARRDEAGGELVIIAIKPGMLLAERHDDRPGQASQDRS